MTHLLFSFSGRITRSQWWLGQFVILCILAVLVLAYVATGAQSLASNPTLLSFVAVAILACVWINLATTVKRYHDHGKSGFWVFIIFVPYIGGVWQIIECGCLPGTAGANDYGPGNAGLAAGRMTALEEELESLKRNAGHAAPAPTAREARYASDLPARASTSGNRGRFGLRNA
ncbi:MAG: DUF805 domain-containing protein [Pseudomonadota bacterium]